MVKNKELSKKIALISATFPPYAGGTGNVCAAHAKQLSVIGYDVHVFTPGLSVEANKLQNYTIHRLHSMVKFGNAFFLPQLLWRLRTYDLIHWHYPLFGGEFTALAAYIWNIPLIITYHQDVVLQGWRNSIVNILERTFGIRALKSARRVLYSSEDYAQQSKFYGELDNAKIGIIPNGVDTQTFIPKASLGDKPFKALLVANLDKAHYFKGVPNFIRAIAETKGIQALIIGDGSLKESYIKMVETYRLGDRLTILGRVNNDQLVQYYQMSDVTILPSITTGEAFGLVLLESLACATPVIASNLPGVRTVVESNKDGFLVRPNDIADLKDKIQMMIQLSPQKRIEMGQMGREKVKLNYTWVQIGHELNKVYQKVLGTYN